MTTFFDSFSPDEIARIASVGTRVSLPAGWSPIWERTPADKAYIVLDGEVSVRRNGAEIARLGAGEIIGEAAIVNHRLRSASIVTLTRATMIHLTAEALLDLREEIPTFAAALESVAQTRATPAA